MKFATGCVSRMNHSADVICSAIPSPSVVKNYSKNCFSNTFLDLIKKMGSPNGVVYQHRNEPELVRITLVLLNIQICVMYNLDTGYVSQTIQIQRVAILIIVKLFQVSIRKRPLPFQDDSMLPPLIHHFLHYIEEWSSVRANYPGDIGLPYNRTFARLRHRGMVKGSVSSIWTEMLWSVEAKCPSVVCYLNRNNFLTIFYSALIDILFYIKKVKLFLLISNNIVSIKNLAPTKEMNIVLSDSLDKGSYSNLTILTMTPPQTVLSPLIHCALLNALFAFEASAAKEHLEWSRPIFDLSNCTDFALRIVSAWAWLL